jgi:hypothetical protein
MGADDDGAPAAAGYERAGALGAAPCHTFVTLALLIADKRRFSLRFAR